MKGRRNSKVSQRARERERENKSASHKGRLGVGGKVKQDISVGKCALVKEWMVEH